MIKPTTSRKTLAGNWPEIHIYEFSKLISAPAARWETLLQTLEQNRRVISRYYQPVREAAVELTGRAGKQRDRIFKKMLESAKGVPCLPNQDPITDNVKAFEKFEGKFLNKIDSLQASLLRRPQPKGTYFEGLILKGLPHMSVTDNSGKIRYVFLYPSAWPERELAAYLELLTIVVESQFNGSAKDIWCMGLKRGTTIPWPKSKPRLRKHCADAATHLCRLVKAEPSFGRAYQPHGD